VTKVLVTGGAGSIGSHVVRQLIEAGHSVVVYDNLSTGTRRAVLGACLVEADLADGARLDAVFAVHHFDAVMHFAASTVVPESVADPLKYYANNTRNTLNLLERISRFKVPHMVFSSTAAVYGVPTQSVIDETTPMAPITPYGASKMISERMRRTFSWSVAAPNMLDTEQRLSAGVRAYGPGAERSRIGAGVMTRWTSH
jgi:UDP-glucose 4-epimerase